jgi:REP element-mobilizing transposase RayT
MGKPWNDWYHVTVHTYGTWLYGDARGWRTRHHREHVEGDYKHPPAPGTFEEKLARSRKLMKREPVYLTVDLRLVVIEAIVEKLLLDQVDVVAASMSRNHLHVLVRVSDHDVREWIGRAKKHSSHVLRQHGLCPDKGGIWGVRCKVEPIKDRSHQLNTVKYILDHRDEGGATWYRLRDPQVRPPRVA